MLKNFSISKKILASVLFVSVMGAGLTAYAAYQLVQVKSGYNELVAERDPAVVDLARVGRNMVVASYAAYRVAYYNDDASMQNAANERIEAFETSYPLIVEIREAFPEMLTEIAALEETVRSLDEISAEAVRLGIANLDDQAFQILTRTDALQDEITEQYRALRDAMLADVARRASVMNDNVDNSIVTVSVGTLAGLMLGILVD